MSRPRETGLRRSAITLVLAVIALLSLVQVASAAQVGAVADITWGQPRSAVDQEIAVLKTAGVRWIRTNVNWSGLEAEGKGRISAGQLAEYDYAVDQARAAGLQILMPISDGVPYWASGDPKKYIDANGTKHWDRMWKPANMADYGDIVRRVVGRYQAKGVHAYEIWNEPNGAWFWSSGPSAAAYVPMLKAGYEAAKAADPASTVLLGGLAKNDFRYLAGVYDAGGGAYFDAVAVHPYTYGMDPTVSWNGANADEDPTRLSLNCFPAIREIKKTMDAYGDAGKKVWITEFGYSTTSANGGVSQTAQAAFLTKAYNYVEQFPWVHSMFWYAVRNTPFRADGDDYEAQFGLTTTDFTPKPSFTALKTYALAQPGSTDSAPVSGPAPSSPPAPVAAPAPAPANQPPTVALTAPLAGSSFASQLALRATATDDAVVSKVEFLLDGKLIARASAAPYAVSWRAPKNTAYGAHTIVARAYDVAGATSTSSALVTRTLSSPTVQLKSTARAAQAGPSPRRRTVVVTGTAPRSISRGVVRLDRRLSADRWLAVDARPVRLRGGRYRTIAAAPASGGWRVRFTTAGPSGCRMMSSYRRVSA